MSFLFVGFTLLAYVNIVTADYHHYLGYLTGQVQSLAQGSVRYGPAIYGYRDNLGYFIHLLNCLIIRPPKILLCEFFTAWYIYQICQI